jgi:hypothetical protein
MFAKIISAGALTLLLTSGALADQPRKIYEGAQPHLRTSHNIYAGHRNNPAQHNIYAGHHYARHAANPTPYRYRWVQ